MESDTQTRPLEAGRLHRRPFGWREGFFGWSLLGNPEVRRNLGGPVPVWQRLGVVRRRGHPAGMVFAEARELGWERLP